MKYYLDLVGWFLEEKYDIPMCVHRTSNKIVPNSAKSTTVFQYSYCITPVFQNLCENREVFFVCVWFFLLVCCFTLI